MTKYNSEYYLSESEVTAILSDMVSDPNMITEPSFRVDSELWPDNKMPFVEAHLMYLKTHPTLNPEHYLSNLRLMIRKQH